MVEHIFGGEGDWVEKMVLVGVARIVWGCDKNYWQQSLLVVNVVSKQFVCEGCQKKRLLMAMIIGGDDCW